VHRACNCCRARFERTRTRTKERALLELQALAEAFDAPQPPVARRLRYVFGCDFPYRLALRRELGEQLVAMGLIGVLPACDSGLLNLGLRLVRGMARLAAQ
jgi:hypothetical protein